MIVVMNVVKAAEGRAADFEEAFMTRERLLSQAPGFAGFELLRRDREDEYVVLTRWEREEDFREWVGSDLFRRSHSRRDDGELAHGNEVRLYQVLDAEVPV